MPYGVATLKRKLCQLKKLEIRLRFKGHPVPLKTRLLWETYFLTHETELHAIKSPLSWLSQLIHVELKAVFDDFFYQLFFQVLAGDNKTMPTFDPNLLAELGLPAYVGMDRIKGRFRVLAKRHHPDLGGDAEKFIEFKQIFGSMLKRVGNRNIIYQR